MKKVTKLVASLIISLACGLQMMGANNYGLPDKIQDGNILHCFDWKFNDIKAMLPQIAEAGFGAVQVSPVQGNCANNAEWYWAYMPYDFAIKGNGNGSRSELQSLCAEAEKYGIKIVVDVVANHVNNAQSNRDPWWNASGLLRWEGGCNYGNRYSITHGQLGDYCDVVSEDARVQQRAKAFIEDLKSVGVKGIRWDAAKHIGLPSENCNFWPVVCGVSGMWHYGEILDGPGGDANKLMKEYSTYMSVTDNGYSNNIRNSVNSGNVPGASGGWTNSAVAEDKVVYWGESHDDYSNEWQASTNIPQDKIDRAWAIGACRKGAVGLYFSRPSATTRNSIKMGQKGSTHFTAKEIAAINHLRNAAVGADDYYVGENGIAVVTRKGVGAAIIIGAGGSRQVSVKNGGGYVPAGSYVDEVSGNRFTVTASTISGQVGNTGIAVIYDSKMAKMPAVAFNPDGCSFRAETLRVTATLINATSGWYKIGNGAQVNITNGAAAFTIGEGVDYGEEITVSWGATGAEGTASGSSVYRKLDPNAAVYVYCNRPNWSSCNAYIYKTEGGEVAPWPGLPMSKTANNLWGIEVPEAFIDGGMVIFNNGSEQYPAASEPGLPISGKSMICTDTNQWREYDGTTGGGTGGNNDQPGTGGGDTSSDGYYIYLKNTDGWNAPAVWAWNDNGNCCTNTNWPGDMMTNAGDFWKWTAPAGRIPTKIIFSNSGNNQTDNLDYVNKATYNCSGTIIATSGTGGTGGNDNPNPGTGGSVTTDRTYCFFDNTQNWASVHVWAWNNDGSLCDGEYPGAAITQASNGYYLWETSRGIPTGIIFSDGNGNKAGGGDLKFENGAIYNAAGNIVGHDSYPGSAGNNPGNPTGDFIVYWDNSEANWTQPSVHFWGGEFDSNWPGQAMNLLSGNIWYAAIAPGSTGLVFNCNGDKTDDFAALNGHIYDRSGDRGAGIEAVENDEYAAPVFYDLRGIRVDAPVSGNAYIVVRGAKVTKELAR